MKIQRTHLLKRLDTLYLSYNTSFGNWKNKDHYVNLRGPRGSGKTELILEWLEQHKHFYFSFAGLDEPMALRLLGERLQKYMDEHNLTAFPMDTWENVFLNINTLSERTCHIFAFDDADEILNDRVFSAAFQKYFETETSSSLYSLDIYDGYLYFINKYDTSHLIYAYELDDEHDSIKWVPDRYIDSIREYFGKDKEYLYFSYYDKDKNLVYAKLSLDLQDFVDIEKEDIPKNLNSC